MSQLIDNTPSTPGKLKPEKSTYIHNCLRIHSSFPKLTLYSFFFLAFILFFFFFILSLPSATPSAASNRRVLSSSWGGSDWEKRMTKSASRSSSFNHVVLVTGFVGTHVSLTLKRRGDGVLRLDNFNQYYNPSLKRARQRLLERADVFVVDDDINDATLLRKLFDVVPFTHVMHLATQARVRYAMQNPRSYIHSNIAGFMV